MFLVLDMTDVLNFLNYSYVETWLKERGIRLAWNSKATHG